MPDAHSNGETTRASAEVDLKAVEELSGLEYDCYTCKDWRTMVDTGPGGVILSKEYPCPSCRRDEWVKWKRSQVPEVGDVVVMLSGDVRYRVVLPSAAALGDGAAIQPCEGPRCDDPVVFVQPEGDGAPQWIKLADLQIVTGL
jgi:hypothetical protein